MNALEKLLDGVAYRRYLSDDHLVTQLFRPSPATVLLDQGIHEMDHALCTTSRSCLAIGRHPERPTAHLRDDPAAAVAHGASGARPGHRRCGVSRLRCRIRRAGRVARSLLRRVRRLPQADWPLRSQRGRAHVGPRRAAARTAGGGAYTLYPEVVQIPLLVHLPASSAATLTVVSVTARAVDRHYADPVCVAGQRPRDLGDLYGQTLFTASDQPIETRRRDSFLPCRATAPSMRCSATTGARSISLMPCRAVISCRDAAGWSDGSADDHRVDADTQPAPHP